LKGTEMDAEKVICAHVEYYADMYPEFARDPIVIRCEDEAVVVWSDSGEPEWGEEAFDVVLCAAHACARLKHYAGGNVSFGMYSLLPEHKALYLAGVRRANVTPMTLEQAVLMSHVGLEEAGLLAREEHADPWDLGYSDAMEARCAALLENERDE